MTFDAPGSGPSGIFDGSGSREAIVGTNGQGIATAPSFTANFTAGSYAVDAHSDFGAVELALSNTAGGLAASITPTGGTPQTAAVNGRYGQPLQARVTDAAGNPVQGAVVSFSIVPGPTGAGAGFLGGGPATGITDSNGVATSPPLQANGSPGRFTAVASTEGVPAVATYGLDNHAAAYALRAVGPTTQSATIDSRYPGPLTARVSRRGRSAGRGCQRHLQPRRGRSRCRGDLPRWRQSGDRGHRPGRAGDDTSDPCQRHTRRLYRDRHGRGLDGSHVHAPQPRREARRGGPRSQRVRRASLLAEAERARPRRRR